MLDLLFFHEENKYYKQVCLDKCLYKLRMLEYDRIDLSKETDVNKTTGSRKFSMICKCTFLKLILHLSQKYVMVAMI